VLPKNIGEDPARSDPNKFSDSHSQKGRVKRINKEWQAWQEYAKNEKECPFQVFVNDKNFNIWEIILTGEKRTPYYKVSWLLYIEFTEEYPASPPNVRFVTPIYHCNINNDGKICHEILTESGWKPQYVVKDILAKIAELLRNPNTANVLDSVKGSLFVDDKKAYEEEVKSWNTKYGKTAEKLKTQYKLK